MQVETLSGSRLHLKRAPGIRSWSLLVGKRFHISPQIRNDTEVFLPCFAPTPEHSAALLLCSPGCVLVCAVRLMCVRLVSFT